MQGTTSEVVLARRACCALNNNDCYESQLEYVICVQSFKLNYQTNGQWYDTNCTRERTVYDCKSFLCLRVSVDGTRLELSITPREKESFGRIIPKTVFIGILQSVSWLRIVVTTNRSKITICNQLWLRTLFLNLFGYSLISSISILYTAFYIYLTLLHHEH